MDATATVRARIDPHTKALAAEALNTMGLSISDAIRMLFRRIAAEQRMPFEVKVPNAETREAIAELEAGKGKRVHSIGELFEELNAGD